MRIGALYGKSTPKVSHMNLFAAVRSRDGLFAFLPAAAVGIFFANALVFLAAIALALFVFDAAFAKTLSRIGQAAIQAQAVVTVASSATVAVGFADFSKNVAAGGEVVVNGIDLVAIPIAHRIVLYRKALGAGCSIEFIEFGVLAVLFFAG